MSESQETPTPDTDVIGNLTSEEMQQISTTREASMRLLAQVGELEWQKQQLLHKLSVFNAQTSDLMSSVTERLGLHPSQIWEADKTGAIRLRK